MIITIVFSAILMGCGGPNKGPEGDLNTEITPDPTEKGVVSPSGEARVSPENATKPEKLDIQIYDDAIMGNLKAPVTMIEFSDFQCIVCKRFHLEVFPEIQKHYIENGKVQFVYKHYPVYQIHQNTVKAAEASECARIQGEFWNMHDSLYKNWAKWQGEDPTPAFKELAAEIGLKQQRFNDCIDSEETLESVGADFYTAEKYSVRGTPTFIINGNVMTGFKTFEELSEIIDAELK